MQFKLVEVDITHPSNKEWFNKYRYDIPVLHLNGKYLSKHRIALDYLEPRLARASQGLPVQTENGDPNPDFPAPPTPLS